jgi:hypothetical protein
MSEEDYLERVAHYERIAEQRLLQYGNRFDAFVDSCHVAHHDQDVYPLPALAAEGDVRMRQMETTGYNLLCQISDMPLGSERGLIFYGNYVARAHHFGVLLATMEREGIIKPGEGQARLGVRASKVLWNPRWDYNERWGERRMMERVDAQGVVSAHQVLESVEIVVQFAPRDDASAQKIVLFLNERANGQKPDPIEDSNDVPDIRATLALAKALQGTGFMVEAQANTLRAADSMAQLVALRQQTPFPPPWRPMPIRANEDLVGYLAFEGVPS